MGFKPCGIKFKIQPYMNQNNIQWWEESAGFFGDFYLEGDNSLEGYLQEKKQNLAQRTEEETKGIITLLSLKEGERILDIPCGYGRHSLELAKQGYDVVGIDINSVHLDKARQQAKDTKLTVDFRKADMLQSAFKGEFDAVINMFYSFGFFATDEENEKVLRNFYEALKPNGKFLMHTDVNIPRIMNGKYKHDETRDLVSGAKLRIIDNYNPLTKRIEGAWILTRGKNDEVRKDYSVRVYSKNDFTALCKKIGFKQIHAYGDWSKELYSEDSEDMIIVAEK